MDTVVLTLAQLGVLTRRLVEMNREALVIENTNIEGTIVVTCADQQFLVGASGAVFEMHN